MKILKYILVTQFVILLSCTSTPQNPSLVALEKMAENEIESAYTITKDLAYGDDKEQTMDVYFSNIAKDLGPKNYTVVFLHGGGYYVSDKAREERYIVPYLQKGMNVVNMNYRLKRGIPLATEDLSHALNFLKEKEDIYAFDLENIIVTGFSAGAQIASSTGLSQNDVNYPHPLNDGISIKGIINFSGPVDDLHVVEDVFVNHEVEIMRNIENAFFFPDENATKEELMRSYEPITYFDKKDPPFFLWHGGKDDQVPTSTFQEFMKILREDPDKNTVDFYPDAGHSPSQPILEKTYEKIFKFLDAL